MTCTALSCKRSAYNSRILICLRVKKCSNLTKINPSYAFGVIILGNFILQKKTVTTTAKSANATHSKDIQRKSSSNYRKNNFPDCGLCRILGMGHYYFSYLRPHKILHSLRFVVLGKIISKNTFNCSASRVLYY
jgi:hypothetical protein